MKKLILTMCLSAAGIFCTSAQMQLTLDQALQLALSENPTIKVANMEIERYDYVRRETWGNWIPQISAGGTYTRSIVKQEMAKGLSFGADNTLSAQGQVNWALFAPTIFRTLKLNKTQMETAVEGARASRIMLVADVKKAFYNILLAEQSLNVLRESETITRQTVNDTEIQFKNGLTSEYDLLSAQVQLSNLRPSILQTENSIKVSKLMLKMYLSIPEDVEIDVIGELHELRDQVLMGADNLSTDVSENTDLRTLDLQKELLRGQLKVSNAGRLPTVSAFFNATYTGNDMDMSQLGGLGGGAAGSTTPSSKNFWWQNPISAGLQLSVPIFSGLTKMNKARQIKNQISQIDLQRSYAKQQIDVQLRSAINNLLTAREMMFAQQLTMTQAQKAYQISDTRYHAGAGTILELNTSQVNMIQAQLSYSQAIYDYITAKADYDQIIGTEE